MFLRIYYSFFLSSFLNSLLVEFTLRPRFSLSLLSLPAFRFVMRCVLKEAKKGKSSPYTKMAGPSTLNGRLSGLPGGGEGLWVCSRVAFHAS